eukprot:1564271-Pyramimonas_sp.AAC.1
MESTSPPRMSRKTRPLAPSIRYGSLSIISSASSLRGRDQSTERKEHIPEGGTDRLSPAKYSGERETRSSLVCGARERASTV